MLQGSLQLWVPLFSSISQISPLIKRLDSAIRHYIVAVLEPLVSILCPESGIREASKAIQGINEGVERIENLCQAACRSQEKELRQECQPRFDRSG